MLIRACCSWNFIRILEKRKDHIYSKHVGRPRHRLVEPCAPIRLHLCPDRHVLHLLDYLQKEEGLYVLLFHQCTALHGSKTLTGSIAQLANLEPWFEPHLQKQIYSSLLEISATGEKTKVPDSVVRAALLRRAVADIGRIIQVRQAKQALNVLLQRGSVGEDLNQRFQRAEKEIEEELREVVMEVRLRRTV